jgi:phosphoribosyl-AMP cyclohydrolase
LRKHKSRDKLNGLFKKDELIPVIIQTALPTGINAGYTNKEAYELTLKTKTAWFYSRSRKQLWNKGETSGNYLHVEKIYTDCDTDTLLYLCKPVGPTCHTGETSCFFMK